MMECMFLSLSLEEHHPVYVCHGIPELSTSTEVCSVLRLLLGLGDVLLDAVHPSKLLSAHSLKQKGRWYSQVLLLSVESANVYTDRPSHTTT